MNNELDRVGLTGASDQFRLRAIGFVPACTVHRKVVLYALSINSCWTAASQAGVLRELVHQSY